MIYRRILYFVAVIVVTSGQASAQQDSVSPLFISHETLAFTLRADFNELRGDRGQDSEDHDAVIEWTDADGRTGTMGMKLRTRGKFRLQRSTCSFPPLRMDFKKDSVAGTPFAGQNKLKLVTFCRDRDSYEENVVEEYLAYRGYNLITETSFRVRLAMVTYEDTSGKNDKVTRYGFMIEDVEALAERVGGRFLDVPSAHPRDLAGEEATLMALYQYLIANTDFSGSYFHNTKLLRLAGAVHVAVPYDFDWAGMVAASYATPHPMLNTRSVRERVYRGYCREDVEMEPIYVRLRAHQAPFEALIRGQPGLDAGDADKLVRYLREFYQMLDSPRKLRRNIERACIAW